jgi:hypothetical protein
MLDSLGHGAVPTVSTGSRSCSASGRINRDDAGWEDDLALSFRRRDPAAAGSLVARPRRLRRSPADLLDR